METNNGRVDFPPSQLAAYEALMNAVSDWNTTNSKYTVTTDQATFDKKFLESGSMSVPEVLAFTV